MKNCCLVLLILVTWLTGCSAPALPVTPAPTALQVQTEPLTDQTVPGNPGEVQILDIPLPAPLDVPAAEISGMDWYEEKLVLLPQYPGRFVEDDGFSSLYFIEKQDLITYIAAPGAQPVEMQRIIFDDGGITREIQGFEGFEAIAFYENHFYVTVEARPGANMLGYVFRGVVEGELEKLTIEPEIYQKVKPQTSFQNASEEALLIFQDRVYSFYEDYGVNKNNRSLVHVYDLDLKTVETIPMDHIEYRITDISETDEAGVFWAINYFFPEDIHLLPASDPIAEKFGEGLSHQEFDPVERLLQFQVTVDGVKLLDSEPIQFELLPDNVARNWEGLVALDDMGFIVATDKFPSTILGFCGFLR